MAERRSPARLDTPRSLGLRLPTSPINAEGLGRMSEGFARMMGTPAFLVGMTIVCAVWLTWNSVAPSSWQFDPRATNFTLLTLILSLQASYAAPLLLLAGNRQEDRDRVQLEQDRRHAEQNLADTQYLTREVAALRIALRDVATRDFVRSELRSILEELSQDDGEEGHDREATDRPGLTG